MTWKYGFPWKAWYSVLVWCLVIIPFAFAVFYIYEPLHFRRARIRAWRRSKKKILYILIYYIFSNLLTKLFKIFGKTLPNFEFVSGFCFRFRGFGDQPGGDLFDDEIHHHVIAEKSKV